MIIRHVYFFRETLKKFHIDINRTIYYNQLLLQTDSMKNGEGVEYQLLDRYSNSEHRRLRLLQAIITNDMQETRQILIKAIEEAIPGIQILP